MSLAEGVTESDAPLVVVGVGVAPAENDEQPLEVGALPVRVAAALNEGTPVLVTLAVAHEEVNELREAERDAETELELLRVALPLAVTEEEGVARAVERDERDVDALGVADAIADALAIDAVAEVVDVGDDVHAALPLLPADALPQLVAAALTLAAAVAQAEDDATPLALAREEPLVEPVDAELALGVLLPQADALAVARDDPVPAAGDGVPL